MKFFKKSKFLVLAALAFLVLIACGGNNKPESSYFQFFDKKGYDSRITYYYKGDKVTKQITDTVIYYSAIPESGI